MVNTVTLRADGQVIVAPFGGFIMPSANQQLSQDDFNECLRICDEIENLKTGAEDYIAKNGLDPAVFNPAHIWDNGVIRSNFEAITSRSYEIINHLRLFCYNFTGFRLADMKFAEGNGPLTEVPPNLDETLRSLEKDIPFVAFEFLKHIQHLPIYAVASPPRIFSEI
ncbi:MAG: hypothetical protein MJE12_06120, partial [Alphaproteobacteria bacterium]|nr:hypothetical protein [Alphaproteobacteria bacterium]